VHRKLVGGRLRERVGRDDLAAAERDADVPFREGGCSSPEHERAARRVDIAWMLYGAMGLPPLHRGDVRADRAADIDAGSLQVGVPGESQTLLDVEGLAEVAGRPADRLLHGVGRGSGGRSVSGGRDGERREQRRDESSGSRRPARDPGRRGWSG